MFDRSIDLQIFGSAASLRLIPSAPRTIQTERGVDFVFALPMSRSEGDWHYRRSLMAARRNVSAIRGLQGLHPSALDGRDRWVLRKGIEATGDPANRLLGATESRRRCLGSPTASSRDLQLMHIATLATPRLPIRGKAKISDGSNGMKQYGARDEFALSHDNPRLREDLRKPAEQETRTMVLVTERSDV